MLLVASETGHVYTFATEKFQPMITSDAGKNLIQSCLSYDQEDEANADNENIGKRISIESCNNEDLEDDEANEINEDDDFIDPKC